MPALTERGVPGGYIGWHSLKGAIDPSGPFNQRLTPRGEPDPCACSKGRALIGRGWQGMAGMHRAACYQNNEIPSDWLVKKFLLQVPTPSLIIFNLAIKDQYLASRVSPGPCLRTPTGFCSNWLAPSPCQLLTDIWHGPCSLVGLLPSYGVLLRVRRQTTNKLGDNGWCLLHGPFLH